MVEQKKYKYRGEEFVIVDKGNQCVLEVSDGTRTATVNATQYSNYEVRLNGWGGWNDTATGAVEDACRLILEHRTKITPEEACDDLHKFFKDV